jgi:hypothetical protein
VKSCSQRRSLSNCPSSKLREDKRASTTDLIVLLLGNYSFASSVPLVEMCPRLDVGLSAFAL